MLQEIKRNPDYYEYTAKKILSLMVKDPDRKITYKQAHDQVKDEEKRKVPEEPEDWQKLPGDSAKRHG